MADTVKEAGVVPVDWETLSQETLPALAVNVVLGLAVSEIVFEPGEAPPAVAENDNDVGVTVSVFTEALIVNCTGTLLMRYSPRLMLMVPL